MFSALGWRLEQQSILTPPINRMDCAVIVTILLVATRLGSACQAGTGSGYNHRRNYDHS
jgi:hypothetical protein